MYQEPTLKIWGRVSVPGIGAAQDTSIFYGLSSRESRCATRQSRSEYLYISHIPERLVMEEFLEPKRSIYCVKAEEVEGKWKRYQIFKPLITE